MSEFNEMWHVTTLQTVVCQEWIFWATGQWRLSRKEKRSVTTKFDSVYCQTTCVLHVYARRRHCQAPIGCDWQLSFVWLLLLIAVDRPLSTSWQSFVSWSCNVLYPWGGTRWCSWLRHCARSRKVTGSIPDGVITIFHCHNPSGRTMALGTT